MRLLCLDVGDKRVGIAFGDSTVRIATPVDVITRAAMEQDLRVFGELIRKFDVEQLIVGLPRNMNGTLGAQAEAVIAYAQAIERALKLPLTFWDERLTTVEAMQRRNETAASTPRTRGLGRGKKSRRTLDAIAAAVILQDYLDSQGNAEK